MDTKAFLGRGLGFPLEIDKRTGKFRMVEHEDDIKEAIKIIIMTYVGERVVRTDFGCRIYDYVFETNAAGIANSIINDVREALVRDEPRITDIEVELVQDNSRDTAEISISYVVRSTNNYFNIVYPFYLMEGIDT